MITMQYLVHKDFLITLYLRYSYVMWSLVLAEGIKVLL